MRIHTALCLLSAALFSSACSGGGEEASNPESSIISSATAAIRTLEGQDTEVMDRCEEAVERCRSRGSDAGADAVCESPLNRCQDLARNLAELRRSAIQCWREVSSCAETGATGDRCAEAAQACEAKVDELNLERANACEVRTQRCLQRDSSEASFVACDNIQNACERVAEQKAARDQRRAARRGEHADPQQRDGARGTMHGEGAVDAGGASD